MVKKAVEKKASAKKVEKKDVRHITPELIYDVLHGKYGAEGERNRHLTAAGYNPSAVTKKINELKKLAAEVAPIKEKTGDYFGSLLFILDD